MTSSIMSALSAVCLVLVFLVVAQSTDITMELEKTQASGKKIFRGSCRMDVSSDFTSGTLRVEVDQKLENFRVGKHTFLREDPDFVYFVDVTRNAEENQTKLKVAFSGAYTGDSPPTGNCSWAEPS